MVQNTMAGINSESQDRFKLYKFTKILTLKVAQIVVQSRQGKKISQEYPVSKALEDGLHSPSNNLQWFNLSIPDEPEVNTETKHILNGEVVEALSKVLSIEILLRTSEGDEMVLEVWTVKILPSCDTSLTSVSTIYYRMSIMLKSTLSISRITPAYKLSRTQFKESYKISHKIYGGQPNLDALGENYKTIKVSELHTPIGTILIEVAYRTKMTILPTHREYFMEKNVVNSCDSIMMKSDHFPVESPRRNYTEKKQLDLSKPLTAGAFVDVERIKELHDTLYQQLPPEPSMTWLLAEKDKMEERMKLLAISDDLKENIPSSSNKVSDIDAAHSSKAIEVPVVRDKPKYCSLMDFPFADGSPIAELANFYQECLQARSATEDWPEITDASASTDSESLAQQLKAFEDAVPEFDSMVASMFSNSENVPDHS